MKISIKYKKAEGWITASLEVVDKEDYTTKYIYKSKTDYPSASGYVLGGEDDGDDLTKKSFIEITAKTSDEAESWVMRELEALKLHLNRWREISVPQDTEIEI